MRTPALQYLYLQKAIVFVVLLCLVSTLPWIGLGDFATKGEPREAAVAVSMIESGNWVLPQVYADEFAYKPPLAHWLMAVCSLPGGEVTPLTSRLPSVIAFWILTGCTMVFFGKRLRFQNAFVSVLLLITCFEMHRSAITCRVDMLLTTFIVLSLYALYRWEDKLELKGLPLRIPLLQGFAVLTKGPVGIVLPLFVFGIYLLTLRRYSYLTIFKALLYAAISSMFLPFLWYFAAWQQGGQAFLDVALAENFGRFFHLDTSAISYELGHENGVWYNFMTLAAGFTPWTLLVILSAFGIRIRCTKPFKQVVSETWQKLLSIEKERLFSLVAIVCIIFFYSIPSSKRSVYLMPAYPFIALFLAEYILYLCEYHRTVIRLFAGIFWGVATILISCIGLLMTNRVDLQQLTHCNTNNTSIARTIQLAGDMFIHPAGLTIFLTILFVAVWIILGYQITRRNNLKIIYASIALMLTIHMITDGVVMRGIRCGSSAREFATEIKKRFPIDEMNTYVMNDLRHFTNLYGLNFYLGNHFHNFGEEEPESGYLFCTLKDLDQLYHLYGDRYDFSLLETTKFPIADVRQRIVFCGFLQNK